ncbi:hypothetical protein NKI86_31010 [Mesorhizobium sp. M0320]
MFVEALSARGVLAHSLNELLSATMALPERRRWLLDRRVNTSAVGQDMVDELRGWLGEFTLTNSRPIWSAEFWLRNCPSNRAA